MEAGGCGATRHVDGPSPTARLLVERLRTVSSRTLSRVALELPRKTSPSAASASAASMVITPCRNQT